MTTRVVSGLGLGMLALSMTLPGAAAEDSAALKKDLMSVISLMGLPCGEVVAVTQKAENDSIATCKDGNRYHVYVNAQGRVVADKS